MKNHLRTLGRLATYALTFGASALAYSADLPKYDLSLPQGKAKPVKQAPIKKGESLGQAANHYRLHVTEDGRAVKDIAHASKNHWINAGEEYVNAVSLSHAFPSSAAYRENNSVNPAVSLERSGKSFVDFLSDTVQIPYSLANDLTGKRVFHQTAQEQETPWGLCFLRRVGGSASYLFNSGVQLANTPTLGTPGRVLEPAFGGVYHTLQGTKDGIRTVVNPITHAPANLATNPKTAEVLHQIPEYAFEAPLQLGANVGSGHGVSNMDKKNFNKRLEQKGPLMGLETIASGVLSWQIYDLTSGSKSTPDKPTPPNVDISIRGWPVR